MLPDLTPVVAFDTKMVGNNLVVVRETLGDR